MKMAEFWFPSWIHMGIRLLFALQSPENLKCPMEWWHLGFAISLENAATANGLENSKELNN